MSVQSEITRLANAKTALATAIEGKGVTVPEGTKLDGMAALVESIDAGGGAKEPYFEETYDTAGQLIDVKFHGYKQIRGFLFYKCSQLALTSLPSGIVSIGDDAFYGCSQLALTSLPSGVTSIGNYAFYLCSKLTSITFEGTPNTIASKAFFSCKNLTTINVPWAEGAVANAPWGATNATINYNYTGA